MLTNEVATSAIKSLETVPFADADIEPKPGSRLRRGVHRWIRRIGRLLLVGTIGAAGQLLGIPAILAIVAATTIGITSVFKGPLATPRSTTRKPTPAAAVLLTAMLVISAFSWSYTGYMTAAGAATFAVRTADWMRDHGLSPVVDQIELRVYGKNEPTNAPVTTDQLPAVATAAPSFPDAPPIPAGAGTTPAAIADLIDDQLAGEGLWTPNTRLVDGAPVTYTSFYRPDPAHHNVVAAAVWMDPNTTTLVYGPGTKEPGGTGWAWKSGIPRSERNGLVSAFNAGFKFKDIDGGLFTEGRTPYPLIDGDASLAIYADGTIDIGTWGTDLTMTPDVVTVRQNLQLLVDNGQVVDGLSTSIHGEWGKRLWQLQYTRRSGIGIAEDGALVYVAGSKLTTETLGNAMAKAGSVRAMELDIHTKQPTFNFFEPDPGNGAGVVGTKLLPDMQRDADRYLKPDQRDFFALVLR